MIATSSPVSALDTSSAPVTTGRPRSGLRGNDVTHFSSRQPVAARRHRAEVAVGRRVDVDLRRHHPLAGRVTLEGGPRPLDRLRRARPPRARRRRRRPGSLPSSVRLDSRPVSGQNGKRRPPRPRIELVSPAASADEAAAIVAALEQFLADTAPAPGGARPAQSPWQRAALEDGHRRPPGEPLRMGPRAAIEHPPRPHHAREPGARRRTSWP